jgi:hypothetical protein
LETPLRLGQCLVATQLSTQGVKHLLHGKGKKVVGFQNWFNSKLSSFIPDNIMMKIKKKLASKQ